MEFVMIGISLIMLMYFAYRGYSIILFAPICAVVATIGSNFSTMPVYSELYMTKAAEYVKTYYPVFLFGAVFAKVMEDGGLAGAVAAKIVSAFGKERAILAVLVGCGVLSYGGLSVFVVAFVMYPLSAILFRQAGIPKKLLVATLWMGIFTYSMVALPGSPQIHNIIPTAFFATTTWSGVFTGLLGAFLYFIVAWGWITYRYKTLAAKGEGYGNYTLNESKPINENLPDWRLAMLPLLIVLLGNLILSNPFHWNWAYHWNESSLVAFKDLKLSLLAANVNRVQAIWSITIALVLGTICAILVGRKRLLAKSALLRSLNIGANSSLGAIFNVASGYAYGSVVLTFPGFSVIKNALLSIDFGTGPLFSEVVTVNLMVGITGSASGGLTIALGMLGQEWLAWAQSIGMTPEILHRIVCIASEGIDSVPHSGALITLMAVCGLTHKDSYYDVFVLTLIKPLVALICVGAYCLLGYP